MIRPVVVLRSMMAGAERYERGAVVDAHGWPKAEKLIRTGYIRDADPAPKRKVASRAQ